MARSIRSRSHVIVTGGSGFADLDGHGTSARGLGHRRGRELGHLAGVVEAEAERDRVALDLGEVGEVPDEAIHLRARAQHRLEDLHGARVGVVALGRLEDEVRAHRHGGEGRAEVVADGGEERIALALRASRARLVARALRASCGRRRCERVPGRLGRPLRSSALRRGRNRCCPWSVAQNVRRRARMSMRRKDARRPVAEPHGSAEKPG